MGAAIVRRDDLDVLALPAAIWLLVLDANVGEVDLVIEVRQVVLVGPIANLIRRAIGMAVVVVVVLVPLVEPPLVLALQLVVEEDALDVRTPVQETVLGLFVRAIDLEVVFEFSFAPQARIERLRVLVIVIAVALQEAATVLRQAHRMVAVSGHARGLDQPLFAQVSQIARPGISRASIVVSEITTGDHSECTNGRERPGFGAAQGVFAVAVVNQLALWSARQVNMSAEGIRDLAIAVSIVAISVGPAGIVIAVSSLGVGPLPVVSGASSERSRVVIIAVARPSVGLSPVVIALVVAGTASAAAARRVRVPLVVSRVVVARVEIKHRGLRMSRFS
jgi:hypothetical protein